MKIMHSVQFYHPAVGGMQEVVKQLSEKMVQLGHDVTVLTADHAERTEKVINGVKVVDFDISGNETNGIKGNIQAFRDYVIEQKFDVIALFAAQQWATDLFFQDDLLKSLPGVKVFIPTGFSGLQNIDYAEYFERMKDRLHWFDMNVFLSNDYQDINFARDNGVSKMVIIPNGASSSEFQYEKQDLYSKDSTLKLLHVGNYTGLKGHKELFYMYDRIKNFPSELWAIGKGKWISRGYIPIKLKAFFLNFKFKLLGIPKRIRLMTMSREETIKKFYEADLFVFPSNIECSPIVLFEAMAAGTPFYSSAAGNAEEIISWSGGGELIPSYKDHNGVTQIDLRNSVEKLNQLLEDPVLREKLGTCGNQAWREKFTWESISKTYLNTYKYLLEGKE